MSSSRTARSQLLLMALLSACGDGLYDAEGLPVNTTGPLACGANLVRCDPDPACQQELPVRCGTACTDCTALAWPANTTAVCNLGRADDGHGACGYACGDGFFACDGDQCCPTTAIAAGGHSSYALVSDGSVRAWGANASGQLGDGSRVDRPVPTVAIASGATAIAAGPAHACAVVAGGAVRCWGANAGGQVTGTSTSAAEPEPVGTPVTSGAVAVAAGGSHTCALLGTGAVTCWGAEAQTAGASSISGATALAAGASHTCAVAAGGAVRCWGANGSGQLGGTPTGGVATPIPSGIQHLAAYGDHTCAASGTSNGDNLDDALRCWGDVLGEPYLFAVPQRTPEIPRRDVDRSSIRAAVSGVATGRSHVCVRAEAVQCLGPENDAGQLGASLLDPGDATTVETGTPPARAVAAGADHACVLLDSGALRCFGRNVEGQLGNGESGEGATPAVGVLVVPRGT